MALLNRRWLRRLLIPVGLMALLLIALAFYIRFEYTLVAELRETLAGGGSADSPMEYGAVLFGTRGCASCHALDDSGNGEKRLGPSLAGIGRRQDADAIRVSILTPDALIAESCQTPDCLPGSMPAYGEILSAEQLDALVHFLSRQ